MNLERERELFDKWYGKKPRGWFEAVRYNTAWLAWQASANREGYKFVPIEPTQEMIYAGESAEHKGCISVAVVYKAMIGGGD